MIRALIVLVAIGLCNDAIAGDIIIDWEFATVDPAGNPVKPGTVASSIIEYWDCTGEGKVPVQVTVPYPTNSWVHAGLVSGRAMCYRVATADSEGIRTQWTGIAWAIVDQPFDSRRPTAPKQLRIGI